MSAAMHNLYRKLSMFAIVVLVLFVPVFSNIAEAAAWLPGSVIVRSNLNGNPASESRYIGLTNPFGSGSFYLNISNNGGAVLMSQIPTGGNTYITANSGSLDGENATLVNIDGIPKANLMNGNTIIKNFSSSGDKIVTFNFQCNTGYAPNSNNTKCISQEQTVGIIRIRATLNGNPITTVVPITVNIQGPYGNQNVSPGTQNISVDTQTDLQRVIGGYNITPMNGTGPANTIGDVAGQSQTLTTSGVTFTFPYVCSTGYVPNAGNTGCVSQASLAGNIVIKATVNGNPVSAQMTISYTSPNGGLANVPVTIPTGGLTLTTQYGSVQPPGTYSVTYNSGTFISPGVSNVTLNNINGITPTQFGQVSQNFNTGGDRIFTFNFYGTVYTPPQTGTVRIRATLNGSAMPATPLNLQLYQAPSGNTIPTSSNTVVDYSNQPTGAYSIFPVAPQNMSYSVNAQSATLSANGTITLTFPFTCSSGYVPNGTNSGCVLPLAIPNPPTNLQGSCSATGPTATLTWTASPGTVAHYQLDTSNNIHENIYSGTSKTFTGTYGHGYTWSVAACNASGCSAPATGNSFSCPQQPVSPTNNAEFVSQSVPTTMTPGQVVNVSVTMKNTGNTTWTHSGAFKLGSQNPQDNITWVPIGWGTPGRVWLPPASGSILPSSVAPNANAVFSFNVTAPATLGTYHFQWKMLQEGVAWFGGPSIDVPVVVAPIVPQTGTFKLLAQVVDANGNNPTPLDGVSFKIKYNGPGGISGDNYNVNVPYTATSNIGDYTIAFASDAPAGYTYYGYTNTNGQNVADGIQPANPDPVTRTVSANQTTTWTINFKASPVQQTYTHYNVGPWSDQCTGENTQIRTVTPYTNTTPPNDPMPATSQPCEIGQTGTGKIVAQVVDANGNVTGSLNGVSFDIKFSGPGVSPRVTGITLPSSGEGYVSPGTLVGTWNVAYAGNGPSGYTYYGYTAPNGQNVADGIQPQEPDPVYRIVAANQTTTWTINFKATGGTSSAGGGLGIGTFDVGVSQPQSLITNTNTGGTNFGIAVVPSVSTAPSGTVSIRATLNGTPIATNLPIWFDYTKPDGTTTSNFESSSKHDIKGASVGTHTVAYNGTLNKRIFDSSGITLKNVTPSASQTLSSGGITTFTFNFVCPAGKNPKADPSIDYGIGLISCESDVASIESAKPTAVFPGTVLTTAPVTTGMTTAAKTVAPSAVSTTGATQQPIGPSVQSASCVSIANNLTYRSKDLQTNNEVSKLQSFLRSKNYLDSESSGYFGILTMQALKNFQKANNISPTGFLGPITKAKIKSLTCN